MYNIDFYVTSAGHCDAFDFLEGLRINSHTSKDSRIQYKQASLYIQLLADNGTNLPTSIVKYLGDDIWELRPGVNRFLFFYYENGTYILLHHFRKQTQKTPRSEIDKAISEMNDYISRKEQES
ncbi:MAG: type II toxin-antitoxin system RelE/ParE family toxin [Butyrivibrio sp.]|nr:type II toxin-antitoxin system RelE/ParE family toxin [Butyrivibrio sp.]